MTYYESFPEGTERPAVAVQGLEQAFLLVPQNPDVRVLLAGEMLRQRRFSEALYAVLPVVQSPHPSELRERAQALAAQARAGLTQQPESAASSDGADRPPAPRDE